MADVLPPATTNPSPAPQQRLEGEQLEEAVLKQIDYYFSRQNLSTDAYLVSQMDTDMWVPISTIAGFKKVHMLTTDVEFIVRVMSKSKNVTVDTTRMAMKPSWKLQRNTLILRDIPSDAPVEEVKALFEGKPVTNVHSDIGDTWFVAFETEDDAVNALMSISSINFRGNPVKARVKAEHLLKSAGGAAQSYQSNPYSMMGDPNAAYNPYRGYAPYTHMPYAGQPPAYWDGQMMGGDGKGGDGRRAYRGGRRPQEGVPVAAAGGRPRGNSRGQGQAPFKGDVAAVPGSTGGSGKSRSRKGKKSTVVEAKQPVVVSNGVHTAPSVIVPQLNQQHFPSLPSPSSRPAKVNFKSGYTSDFRKFSKDDLLRIINTVGDVATRPATLIVAEPGVVEQKPNTNLEIANAPPTPDLAAAPEPIEPVAAAPAAPAQPTNSAAPGVAVREWPLDKTKIPAQVFVPKKTEAAAASPNAASVPASPSATASQPTPQQPTSQAAPQQSTSQPAASSTQSVPLRTSSEQASGVKEVQSSVAVPSSPSLNSSSEGVRKSTYADIALGAGRTSSPPIANGKSPASPAPSPLSNSSSTTLSSAVLSAAPPAPSVTALEGKQQ